MPKSTVNSGSSNGEPEPVAVFEGEHGPELELSPGAVGVPGGADDGAHESRAPIVADPVLPAADAPDYGAMQLAALRAEAAARELPVSGTKADLAARLADHDAAQPPPADGGQ